MTSNIRDNRKYGNVADFLKEKITEGSDVSIVSAYFTIYAYYNLHENLDSVNHTRFLFGEPTFTKNLDPEKMNVKEFKIQDDTLEIPLENRLHQKKVAKLCSEWIKNKVEVKSLIKPNFLHGKLYLIEQANGNKEAISGSSNFTTNGIGLGQGKNMELNLVVDSKNQLNELKDWFDELWNDKELVEDVKEDVLKYINQIYSENEPEFVYFKTLYTLFSDFLKEQKNNSLLDEESGFFESEIWNMLYDFQKDGVKGAINKILKNNGCIIADSVGLGKTFEALAIIQYFTLKRKKILVLCPKKLSSNWTVYQTSKNNVLNPFKKDEYKYHVLYHTDLGRITGKSAADGQDFKNFDWAAYDLVVIDESHNLRGNQTEKTDDNGDKRMNRTKWLMDKVIKGGIDTKVLLLSATPVNNTLKDLRNQIYYITGGKNNALSEVGINSIEQTIATAQRQFTLWADPKKNPSRSSKQLFERLDASFFKLLDEMTIARSRKHIKEFYDVNAIGTFPERLKPISIYSPIDSQDDFPSYQMIDKMISEYKLSLFSPFTYVKDEKKKEYAAKRGTAVETYSQEDRENYLIGMMKVNFLKRLESSIHSFMLSLERTIEKIVNLENLIKKYKETGISETVENEIENIAIEDDEFEIGDKLKYKLCDMKLDEWLKDLSNDRKALKILYQSAKEVDSTRDEKLNNLKELIEKKCKNPINNDNKKVVVFTAFSDTAEYLYKNIKKWAKSELGLESAFVCGDKSDATFGDKDFDSILVNFSPISKKRANIENADTSNEISILIATDCISEGQNLQDCDYLVNFDIHWNPVRIIQRFGRIDRIGSKNTKIQLVNFWVTEDLDEYLNLKTRVESRMTLVDITATGEDDVLQLEKQDTENLLNEEEKFRSNQLKRLKDEVLDLEDLDESISLTDFTLDDFRMELSAYLNSNEKRLKDSPDGIYAIVPASEKYDVIKPGVIYCLKQKNVNTESRTVNPLNPYFLVYVLDDGNVRYTFSNAKQILEIFRETCEGKHIPYEELCDMFNKETDDGENMGKYVELLKKGADACVSSFRKKEGIKLTQSRTALLISKDKKTSNMNDFELISWLIIK